MIFRIAFEGTALEINFGNPVFDNFYSEFESLLAHVFHKLGSGNRGRKTGEVFNVGRDCQLSAGLGTGDYGCRQSGSCCVNAGGITGRAGTDDKNFTFVFSHFFLSCLFMFYIK